MGKSDKAGGDRRGRQAGRRPTMTDVARLAGVSQSSVSLVLNHMTGARISDLTRERVIAAARAVGYRLQGRRTGQDGAQPKMIAYFVDEISTSPHPVVTIDGARDAAWEAGHLLAVHVTRADPELEAATLRAVLEDGALLGVIYSTIFTRKVHPPAGLLRVPTVLLNCYTGDRSLPSVVPGEVAGGYAATEFVLQHGHRRIGFINGEPWMDAARDRLKGYRQALATADVAFDPDLIRNGDWMPDTGYRRTYELLRLNRPPTAIFCANDLMAVGALEALAELGIRVPDDMSVMGYDDQEVARYTRPPLSSCVLPNYEMGHWAAEHLMLRATEAVQPGAQRKMECPVIPRGSVAAPCSSIEAVVARNSDRIFAGPKTRPVQRPFSWSGLVRMPPEAV